MSTNTIEYKNDGVYYNNVKIEGPNFENIIQASNYTLTTDDCTGFKLFNNNGATGDITYTLPTAAEGLEVTIVNTEEHNLKVQASSGDLIFTPKYKYGVDYVDLKQSVSTTFYCVNGTDWHAKEDLSTLWGQVQKLMASDGITNNYFGVVVDFSDNYAIISARFDDEVATNSGAVYIFRRTGFNNWDDGVKIFASDLQLEDKFGWSTMISDDFAIVGCPYRDDQGADSGAVYVYQRTGANTWGNEFKITASDGAANHKFGSSVDIFDDYILVGATGATGTAILSGAAYVYQRTGANTWGNEFKITASDGESLDEFGTDVTMCSDYVVIGTQRDGDNGADSGAAYVYQRTGANTWGNEFKITAFDGAADHRFGYSVSLSGDFLVVGSPFSDFNGADSGAAYVYQRTGANTWGNETRILPGSVTGGDYFGWCVSISGDYIACSAHGNEDSDSAYIFKHSNNNIWNLEKQIFPSEGSLAVGSFSTSLCIGGGLALIGSTGSAYIFTLE